MKILYFIILALLVSCTGNLKYSTITGSTMGTSYKLVVGGRNLGVIDLKKKIDNRLEEINQQMSTYIEDSEISMFNKAEKEVDFKISQDFNFVMNHSFILAKLTEGHFDPTVYPLVNLWGFGPNSNKKEPSKSEVEKFLALVSYEHLRFNPQKGLMKKLKDGVQIDLSATAKGYGVDAVGKLLESEGVVNYLVEIGGEIRIKGEGPKGKWRIGIEQPNFKLKRFVQQILHISNYSMATSGSYRNFYNAGDKVKSHMIDPKTGHPTDNNLLSVTVLDSKSCMNADGLATAFMVMGLDKAYSMAQNLEIPAYFIYKDKEKEGMLLTKMTDHFKKLAWQKK